VTEQASVSHRVAQYGTTRIAYWLVRRPRKTLSIKVLSDGTVQAAAPLEASETEIERRIAVRGAWILRQRELAVLSPPLPARKYLSGESYRYLDRQHRLRLQIRETEGVKITRGELLLTVCSPNRAERLLQGWFRARAQQVIEERMAACLELAAHHGVQHDVAFRLRRMATRWGSCTRTGQLTFNPLLVQAPKECINYVLLHELCHVKEFSHARA